MKNTLIKNTTLSIRCINCLHAADIRTTDDLKLHIEKYGIDDFVKFRHFGFKTFDELRKFVEENKLMSNDVPEDAKKLAIEFSEYIGNRHLNRIDNFKEQYWQKGNGERFTTQHLFDKFIEQRNK